MSNCERFGRKLREEIHLEEIGLLGAIITDYCLFPGPMGKIEKSGLVLLSGLTQGTCANFQKILTKTEGGYRFLRKWANRTYVCPFLGPWAKSGLVPLSELILGTCVPNFNIWTKTEKR